jgi:hypothetical protein
MTAMKPQKSNAEFWGLLSLEPCYTSTTATFHYQLKKNCKNHRQKLDSLSWVVRAMKLNL